MTDQNPNTPDDSADKPASDSQSGAASDASPPTTDHRSTEYTDDDSPSEPIVLATPDDPDADGDWYLWAGVLVLLALGCCLPAITGQFLLATDRQFAAGQGSAGKLIGIVDIWTDPHASPQSDPQYHPVTLTAYWLLRAVWSGPTPNPVGFRAANLLLHAIAVVLLWRVLRRLAVPGAFVIAAFWAIHPVQAETLCTVSQLKTILAAVFSLGSIWFFFDYADVRPPPEDTRQPARLLPDPNAALAASIVFFLLAVLSQPAIAVLPFALVPILIWKNRAAQNILLAMIPFFVIGIAAGCLAISLEHSADSIVAANPDDFSRSVLARILIASRCLWFYLGKLLVPLDLSAMYGKWPANDPWLWLFLAGAIAVPAALFALRRRIGLGPIAAVAWFAIMLFPHLGLFDLASLRHTDVADHFQYLPSIAPIALLISGIAILFQSYRAAHPIADALPDKSDPAGADSELPPVLSGLTRLAMLVTLAFLVLVGVDTLFRSEKFASPISLWTDATSRNPDDPALWPAHRLLALALNEQAHTLNTAGDVDEAHTDSLNAIGELKFVLQVHPRGQEIETLTDLGATYRDLNRPQEAAGYLKQAADQIAASPAATANPIYYSTYLDLGIVLDQLAGQQDNPDYAPAIAALDHANDLLLAASKAPIPDLPAARIMAAEHAAAAYFHAKRYDDAVHFQQYLVVLDPTDLGATFVLAEYLAWDGQLELARKTQAQTMANYFNTFHSVPPSYSDFMGILEMNQNPPNAKLAQSLFSDAHDADPNNSGIAAHLAAANDFLAWAATTQPTTQSATQTATTSTTVPTTKPVPPRDFTLFLTTQPTTVPATGPATSP